MPKFPDPRVTIAATLSLVLLTGGCAYLSGGGGSAGADPDSPECEPYKQWQDIGGTVSIYASIRDVEAERLERAWQKFVDCTGIKIQYEGSGEFEAQVQVKVDGGNAPDIAFFPQPGLLERFAKSGDLVAAPESVQKLAEEGWSEDWLDYATFDGELYFGTPLGANFKSFVWYSPTFFSENGYEVPQTWDELIELSDTIADDGVKPWCVGFESGDATGWPGTDWIENVVLRENGPDVYDQWVNHDIPFNDSKIADAFDRADTILRNPDYVNGGFGNVQTSPSPRSRKAACPSWTASAPCTSWAPSTPPSGRKAPRSPRTAMCTRSTCRRSTRIRAPRSWAVANSSARSATVPRWSRSASTWLPRSSRTAGPRKAPGSPHTRALTSTFWKFRPTVWARRSCATPKPCSASTEAT